VSQIFSKEQILDSLRKFYADHGRAPKAADLGAAGIPTVGAISRLFGSLRSGYDAAGIPQEGRESLGERMPWPEDYFGVKSDDSK
jgi:Homing endonuclease associated repeat